MNNSFIFDGMNSSDFGIWISGTGTYTAPERDVEYVSVPGRNGDLIIDNGRWRNVPLTYPAYIESGFPDKASTFRSMMCQKTGYRVLEDTYHPDEYRMAQFTGGFEPQTGQFNRNASFDINFMCKPQRFLKSGTVPMQFIIPIPGGTYEWKTPIIPVYNQTDLNFTLHCDPTDTPSVIVDKLDADDTILRSVTNTGHDGDDFNITFENDVVSWRITIDNRYSDTSPDLIRMEIRTTTVFDGKPIPVNARFGRTQWIQNPTGYEAKPLIEVFGNILPSTDIENYEGTDKYSWFAFFVDSLGTDGDIQHFWMDCEMQYVYDDEGTNWTNKLTLTDYQHEMHNGLVFPFLGKDRIKLYWYGGTGGLGLINIYPRWWKL